MKLSTTIEKLLDESTETSVTLGTLMERTQKQGFGIVAGFLTVPMLIPWPIPLAGFSTLMGAGIVVVGWQLARGYHQPILPKKLAQFKFSPQMSQRFLTYLNRVLHPLERLAQPRYKAISYRPAFRRITGACMSWNAILMGLPLPIPFTNLVPAYSILSLVIGLLEEDGLLILVGYGATVATTLFFVSISSAIWALVRSLLASFPGS